MRGEYEIKTIVLLRPGKIHSDIKGVDYKILELVICQRPVQVTLTINSKVDLQRVKFKKRMYKFLNTEPLKSV